MSSFRERETSLGAGGSGGTRKRRGRDHARAGPAEGKEAFHSRVKFR
jgi:hypothetical protein